MSIHIKDGIINIIEVLNYTVENAKKVKVYDTNKALIDVFIFARILSAAKIILNFTNSWKSEDIKKLNEKINIWRKYIFDEKLFKNNFTKYFRGYIKNCRNG